MRWLWGCTACLLALGLGAWVGAQDDEKEEAATPEEQVDALEAEFKTTYEKLVADFNSAKSADEQEKIRQQYTELMQSIPARFLEIANAHPKTQAACDALVWIVSNTGIPEWHECLDKLIADHAEHEGIAKVCHTLMYRAPDACRQIIELALKSPHDVDRGNATFCLAFLKKQESENSPPDQAEALAKEAEELFDQVVSEFADVEGPQGPLGTVAEGELFVMRHLGIGKVAPEMEGEDIDGVAFKLSDYRGRVVMLDFWGSW